MAVWSAPRHARRFIGAAALLAIAGLSGDAVVHAQNRRDFTITATKGDYKVSGSDKKEIRVTVGDVVHITFEAQDIAHSFTTVETSAHYRIDRRAEPGTPVTFEFRADRVGEVPIRCILTIDPKCKDASMLLTLVVVEPK